MKKYLKHTIWMLLLIFLAGNVFVFVHSIHLSDNINHFEEEIKKYQQNNLILENKIYAASSFQYAASIAAELNFTEKNQPIFLENVRYALNR